MKPIVLCIMDGCGIRKDSYGNAFLNANKPNLDFLFNKYPNSLLEASGISVGLPDKQMGNSEVGHMNIGAGRVCYQPLTIINKSINDGSLKDNDKIKDIVKHLEDNNSNLHIMGLVSDGGVHSHIDHLIGLLDIFNDYRIKNIYLHLFTDGRDTGIKEGFSFVKRINDKLNDLNNGKIVTITGRYYAMDRDNNFDRINLFYDTFVNNNGKHYNSIDELFNDNYNNDITDEFIKPSILEDIKFSDNDVLLTFNFRPDRLREISTVITNPKIYNDNYKEFNNIKFLSMMPINNNVKGSYIFDLDDYKNTLGIYLNSLGFSQLRIAETEKYAHVTYFFDGGREIELDKSKRILIPSLKVKTYDLKPEMSAYQITDSLLNELDNPPDFVVLNFANGDMVGHTGNYDATVKGIEVIDECIGKIYEKIKSIGGLLIITSDHGNSDIMINEDNIVCTTHTSNKVPFIVCLDDIKLNDGKLCDIAPTILDIMNIKIPNEMTGISLINKEFTNNKNNDRINIERIDNMNENNEPIVIEDEMDASLEVKEEPIEEIKEEPVVEEVKEVKVKKPKKRGIFSTLLNILVTLLFIFVLVETYIGFTGFNAIKADKEPKYLINKFETEKDGIKETTYNFGLYKCVKGEDNKRYTYKLLPFFLD